MNFFSLDREIQRDIIWEKIKSKDVNLELRVNQKYKERNDLKKLNKRFYLNNEKTQFWKCEVGSSILTSLSSPTDTSKGLGPRSGPLKRPFRGLTNTNKGRAAALRKRPFYF